MYTPCLNYRAQDMHGVPMLPRRRLRRYDALWLHSVRRANG